MSTGGEGASRAPASLSSEGETCQRWRSFTARTPSSWTPSWIWCGSSSGQTLCCAARSISEACRGAFSDSIVPCSTRRDSRCCPSATTPGESSGQESCSSARATSLECAEAAMAWVSTAVRIVADAVARVVAGANPSEEGGSPEKARVGPGPSQIRVFRHRRSHGRDPGRLVGTRETREGPRDREERCEVRDTSPGGRIGARRRARRTRVPSYDREGSLCRRGRERRAEIR